MRFKRPDTDPLTPAQRDRLRLLLEAVPDDAGQDDPRFVELLGAWEACNVVTLPVVPAYRLRGGRWLIRSVPAVLAAIGGRVEDESEFEKWLDG